jgi:holo-[acyl-carrier protein] synthase
MVCGVGIDLVDVSRIEKILEKRGGIFTRRVFTIEEIAYCRTKPRPALHFAACFAVKEAFLKALGIGLGGSVSLLDIATIHNGKGSPSVKLSGKASDLLQKGGMGISVSISHTDDLATAVVILDK